MRKGLRQNECCMGKIFEPKKVAQALIGRKIEKWEEEKAREKRRLRNLEGDGIH